MKLLKKLLLFPMLASLTLILLIAFSGHAYIFTAIRDTYLRGRLTPPITETGSVLAENTREVKAGAPQPWPLAADYNRRPLSDTEKSLMSSYRTAAFVVIKDGALVHETYWPGFHARSRTNSNSVAKSFIGTLTGIALAQGKLKSLDQPVSDFFPEFKTGERAKLTIRHLLTMSAATDFSEDYDNPLALPARAHFGTDLRQLLLRDFKVVGEPGKTHKYDSSNTALLGLVLSQATGQSLSGYLSEKLWQPLGAEQPALWALDHADGMEKAYCCLYASARDYARLGQLYLNGGKWQGRQLVPAAYVTDAIKAADLVDATGAKTQRYGYSWWRTQRQRHTIFYAWGYQGQYIAVIPDLHIVMVRLGDGGGYTQNHDKEDLAVYLDAALGFQ